MPFYTILVFCTLEKKNRKQPTDEKKHMIEMVLFCRENAQKNIVDTFFGDFVRIHQIAKTVQFDSDFISSRQLNVDHELISVRLKIS